MKLIHRSLWSLIATLLVINTAQADELAPISVTTTVQEDPIQKKSTGVETDASSLVERVPGGGIHTNGQISGQTYFRGSFGPRNKVVIDNFSITSAGPNWMDPPLHYQPNTLIEEIEVERGLNSVSNGTALGTTITVSPKTSRFSDSEDFQMSGEFEGSVHSVDSGYNTGGIVTFANNKHRFHITSSRDDGDDYRAGDGDVDGTEYERDSIGTGYGVRFGEHEFGFDARYVSSKDTGTPSLPLDPNFFHNEIYNAKYRGNFNNVFIEFDVFHTDIEHQMRNFDLRPAPNFSDLPLPPFLGDDRRELDVNSDDTGAALAFSTDLGVGELRFGVDGNSADHSTIVMDPDVSPFFIETFNNSEVDVAGIFSEWQGSYKDFSVELGLRYNRVKTDTDEVDAQPANLPLASTPGTPPAAVRALRDRFNAADLSQTDYNLDLLFQLAYPVTDNFTLTAGFARKSRSPSYVERYLWIPLNVNAGLGDGNNYIGDPDLDPEWSNQFELGFDWIDDKTNFSPRVYYNRINNYIQGVAVESTPFNMPVIGVSGLANGDATPLQFANVEAEIYGIDTDWGYQINELWSLSGIASFTRGKRRDVNDDLFHIAPARATLGVTRQFSNGSVTLEGVAVARQSKVSDELTDDPGNSLNNNDSTPGYGLVNLYGEYTPQTFSNLSIQAGIENLFDKNYTDHLNGFNRVASNGVDLGERLPGPGLNAFLTLKLSFDPHTF